MQELEVLMGKETISDAFNFFDETRPIQDVESLS